MTIIILGLGPGDPKHLTREAWEVVSGADEIWVRTSRHPTLSGLPERIQIHSFDSLYEAADDFAVVYETIAGEVLRLGERESGVLYAVPGHPLVGEASVQRILEGARESGLPVRIVEGLSFLEPTLTQLGIDGMEGLQICDGIDLATAHHPALSPDRPALVGQIYSRAIAADVKLTLMNQYPDDHPVVLLDAVGTDEARTSQVQLYELDRCDVMHLTSLYIPPIPDSGFEGLQEMVAHLRAPEGCPWDQEQTIQSLQGGLIEEAYEATAAIDGDDLDGLREELGDLLLQVAMMTQIATEEGDFLMVDVVSGVNAKLRHRHPHVWGDVPAGETKDVVGRWERLKLEEKEERESLLDGIPPALPALLQAFVYGERVARVGFDWPDVSQVVEKVREEMGELLAADEREEVEAELGDLLFAIANWARHLGIEPEAALRKGNARFGRRFRVLEGLARERDLELGDLDIEGLEALWQEAKNRT